MSPVSQIYAIVLLVCIPVQIHSCASQQRSTYHKETEGHLLYHACCQSDIIDDDTKEFLMTTYGGFFRSYLNTEIIFVNKYDVVIEEDGGAVVEMGKGRICKQTETQTTCSDFSISTYHKETEGHLLYHACCQSEALTVCPTTARTEDGQNVTLVQMKHHPQCFDTSTCSQVHGCEMLCGCRLQVGETRALIYNPNPKGRSPFVVRSIVIANCCKCINNVAQSTPPAHNKYTNPPH